MIHKKCRTVDELIESFGDINCPNKLFELATLLKLKFGGHIYPYYKQDASYVGFAWEALSQSNYSYSNKQVKLYSNFYKLDKTIMEKIVLKLIKIEQNNL